MHFYLPGWEIPKTSRDSLTLRYGFVTDYLAEAFRAMRKQNRFDLAEQHVRFGSQVEGRDATATRKTVSGLAKLLHPDGEITRAEVVEYVELAMEGRRRVKEQLKKRGSFEFHRTSFSYIEEDSGVERTVGVPEQGGGTVISPDPLPPGNTYAVIADNKARVGLFRIEVSLAPGNGKLRTPSGLERGLKESVARALSYLGSIKERMGIAPILAQKDIAIEAIDLSGSEVDGACGVAFYVAILSAIQNRQIQPGTVILGDLTVQGNLRGVSSILEPLQVALENGATRSLVPISNKTQFAALPEEVVEQMDIVFYGDLERAALKSLEL